jgi:hypothetical protein
MKIALKYIPIPVNRPIMKRKDRMTERRDPNVKVLLK